MKMVHKSCLCRAKNKYKIIQGHLIECCQAENKDCKEFDSEISILETTLKELSEETNLKAKHILKLKKDQNSLMEEALKNEEELNDIINKQKEHIDKLLCEIKELQKQLNSKVRSYNTISTQTLKPDMKSVPSQTSVITKTTEIQTVVTGTESHTNSTLQKSGIFPIHNDQPQSTKNTKPRITLIAGEYGRDCGRLLNNLVGSTYSVHAIIKPGAPFTVIMETVKKEQNQLSERDYLIIWPDKGVVDYKLLLHSVHNNHKCKIVVMSQPYLHYRSACEENTAIHLKNEKLSQICTKASKTNRIKFFECNSILRNHHFQYKSLKYEGKLALMKKIKILLDHGVSIEPVLIPISHYDAGTYSGNESNLLASQDNIMTPRDLELTVDRSVLFFQKHLRELWSK